MRGFLIRMINGFVIKVSDSNLNLLPPKFDKITLLNAPTLSFIALIRLHYAYARSHTHIRKNLKSTHFA
jgi:hypothetical protein